ncbi:MAG: hypothetical protein JO082_15490 [Mycobacterium sp.]|nr:hypothetical protein [Mycobacterium sp.]MBV9723305.1 hypothetical protein [Mycobacterium sp.]
MKAKREAPPPRGGDRRRGQNSASPISRRRPADPTPARRTRRTRLRPGKASAPVREPRASRSAPQTVPTARPVERSARPKNASQAKARAKARKAKAPKVIRPPLRDRLLDRLTSIDLRPRTLAAKVPFVVLVIGSLGAGLGVTLWLSTDAAERSYQLGSARQRTQLLQQQKEALERDVLQAQSAPELAEAARGLGMIPTRDTAHLVQDPAGNWVVVGTPKPAQGVPPPPLNSKLPDEKPLPPPAAANSVEVPTRVSPDNRAPGFAAPPGPQVMLRAPDGATTLGTEHLPIPPGAPQLPAAAPGPAPQVAQPAPAAAPLLPPPPAAPAPAAAPALPVPAVPVAPAAPPPELGPAPVTGPAPLAGCEMPPGLQPMPAPAPETAPPMGVPHHATPAAPLIGEQFGPLTVTTPGAPR